MKKRHRGKHYTQQTFIGRQGVQLIDRILTAKKWFMTETTQHTDGGIDGFVEVGDPVNAERTNLLIKIQSKATTGPWTGETSESFEYLVDERDLKYWLQGNGPVVLIVSRPADDVAYWISVRDYFDTPAKRRLRKVFFDKRRDRFNEEGLDSLLVLASNSAPGVYFGTPQRKERLISNMLPLQSLPSKVFVAKTDFRKGKELGDALKDRRATHLRSWYLHDGGITTLHDLHESAWDGIVDRGTIETISTADWSESSDPKTMRGFVRLLNQALQDQLGGMRIWRDKGSGSRNIFFVGADGDNIERRRRWMKATNTSKNSLVLARRTKAGDVVGYRHRAFAGQFRRFGPQWYLVIEPTYHFTSDGWQPSRYAESDLAGIKRLERNMAFDGHLRLWVDLFTSPDLFERNREHLSFGRPVELPSECGIPDAIWSPPKKQQAPTKLEVPVEPATTTSTLQLF